MTTDAFHRLAMSLPCVDEGSHMGHIDFRIKNRIFATLPKTDPPLGMVKLTPDQQAQFIDLAPEAFEPVPGGWGARGATYIHLRKIKLATARKALLVAWRNTAPKRMV